MAPPLEANPFKCTNASRSSHADLSAIPSRRHGLAVKSCDLHHIVAENAEVVRMGVELLEWLRIDDLIGAV